MVTRNQVVIIDLTFLLESSERSFYGAPLISNAQGEDNTVLYGVVRDLMKLRKSVGISHAIVVIGSEAATISSEVNLNRVLRFLRRLRTTVVYEPTATTASLCRSLSSVARWVATQNKVLFQLVTKDSEVMVPDVVVGTVEFVSVESLKTTFGIRPAQVPSFLALTEGEEKAVLTKRQAIRLLEVYDNLTELLRNTSAISSHHVRRHLCANEKGLLGRVGDMTLQVSQHPKQLVLAGSTLAFLTNDQESADLLRECGFWSLVRQLPLPITAGVAVPVKVKNRVVYKAIRNEAELRELEALVSKSEVCAVDTEASDKDPRSASLFGVAFSVRAAEAFYVPGKNRFRESVNRCDHGASTQAFHRAAKVCRPQHQV
jgi:hypothetical protein